MHLATRLLPTVLASFNALTLLATGASATTPSTQYPFNRRVTSVEVLAGPSQQPDMYVLRVGFQIAVGNVGAPSIDLSSQLRVLVDGIPSAMLPVDSHLTMSNNGGPCEGPDACSQPQQCGWNDSTNMQMYCVDPGFGDCYCTSDSFLELDEIAIPSGGNVIISIGTTGAQIAEIYTVDDDFSFDLLGAKYCVATPNSTGMPATVRAQGTSSVQANDLTLLASPLPEQQFGLFFYGSVSAELPFGDGYRCVGGQIFRLGVASTGLSGELVTQVDLTSPPELAGLITPGSTHYFQAWYRDPAGGQSGFNLSEGYRIEFGM